MKEPANAGCYPLGHVFTWIFIWFYKDSYGIIIGEYPILIHGVIIRCNQVLLGIIIGEECDMAMGTPRIMEGSLVEMRTATAQLTTAVEATTYCLLSMVNRLDNDGTFMGY